MFDAKYWQWYVSGCGVNAIGSGNEITVSPTATTTYFVRAEGGCVTNGSCNSITIKVNKPTTSYSAITRCKNYFWNGNNYTESGIYTWKGINSTGCDSIATLDLTILLEVVQASISASNANCYGSASGSITVSPVNGQAPYQYKLGTAGNYVNTNTFYNLKAGKYSVFISDARGCTGSINQITINQKPEILGNVNATHVNCFGYNSGSITINGSNGTPPYLYKKGTAGAFTNVNTFSNLFAGTQRIYIQDAMGCIADVVTEILQPTPLDFTVNTTAVQCFGNANGGLLINGNGGTFPFMYMIGKMGSFSTNNIYNNLAAGTYEVYLKDSKNCIIQKSITIQQPPALQVILQKKDANCNNSYDGSIRVFVSGGVPPYKYKLGAGSNFSNSNFFSSLAPGNYTAYYSDSNNCTGFVNCTIINLNNNCIRGLRKQVKEQSTHEDNLKIKISPNPWRNYLNITTNSISNSTLNIRLCDMYGKKVANIICNPNATYTFKENLAAGAYLIEIIQDKTTKRYTIIKQ